MKHAKNSQAKRLTRVRAGIRGTADRPRLSVFRSHRHIFAQIINDDQGITLISASDQHIKSGQNLTKTQLAQKVGTALAKKALKAKINKVVFDRGLYKFHGRVKALAAAAREAGLKF